MMFITYFLKLLLYRIAYGSFYKARTVMELELANELKIQKMREEEDQTPLS
jgi:hypothetical protein